MLVFAPFPVVYFATPRPTQPSTCSTVSNSLRAIKTTRQASVEVISYPAAVRGIIASRGVTGLLFGGLGTRLMANGLQGIMFAVLWKLLEEQWNKPAAGAAAAGASPLK